LTYADLAFYTERELLIKPDRHRRALLKEPEDEVNWRKKRLAPSSVSATGHCDPGSSWRESRSTTTPKIWTSQMVTLYNRYSQARSLGLSSVFVFSCVVVEMRQEEWKEREPFCSVHFFGLFGFRH